MNFDETKIDEIVDILNRISIVSIRLANRLLDYEESKGEQNEQNNFNQSK